MTAGHQLELFFPLHDSDLGPGAADWPDAGLSLGDWRPELYGGFASAAAQMPRVLAVHRGGEVSVDPALEDGAAGLGGGTLALLVTPQGDATMCLSVSLHGGLDAFMSTLQALRDEAAGHRVLYDGVTPLEALASTGGPALARRLAACEQRGPVASQHACVIDTSEISLFWDGPEVSVEADVADIVDFVTVGRLVYYDAYPYGRTPVRRGQSGVSFPALANRYARTLAAVAPNGSVITGHADGLVAGMVLSHVIVHGAKQRADAVRGRAYADLAILKEAEKLEAGTSGVEASDETRSTVAGLIEGAGRHRVALAFGAEAYLDIEPVIPSSVIGSYHRALVAATRAGEGIATANLLLVRLDEALSARLAVVRAAERASDEARNTHLARVGGILAAIAIILTFVFGVYSSDAKPYGSEPLVQFKAGFIAFVIAVCALIYLIWSIYRGDWRLRRPGPLSTALRRRARASRDPDDGEDEISAW